MNKIEKVIETIFRFENCLGRENKNYTDEQWIEYENYCDKKRKECAKKIINILK